jgi:GYF domain 2
VDIYVYMQGQRRGPYDKAQLQEMWNRGKLPKDTLYWYVQVGGHLRSVRKRQDGASFAYTRRERRIDGISLRVVNAD